MGDFLFFCHTVLLKAPERSCKVGGGGVKDVKEVVEEEATESGSVRRWWCSVGGGGVKEVVEEEATKFGSGGVKEVEEEEEAAESGGVRLVSMRIEEEEDPR